MGEIDLHFVYDRSSMLEPRVFTSTRHPGELPWPVVYGRALVRPLAACMLPVMIVTLVAVLEGMRILPGAVWAAGVALFIASFWTTFRIQSDVAEIRVDEDAASVRTVWEILNDVDAPPKPILAIRDYGTWMHLTVGLTNYELERSLWPRYDNLVRVLRTSYAQRRRGG